MTAVFDETTVRLPSDAAEKLQATPNLLTYEANLSPAKLPVQPGDELGTVDCLYEGRVLFHGRMTAAVAMDDASAGEPSAPAATQALPEPTAPPAASDENATAPQAGNGMLLSYIVCAALLIILVVLILIRCKQRKRSR